MLKCQRCAYEWQPKTDRKPKECPDCKSRKWETPKVETYREEQERTGRGK